jgi:hypothetical protein
MATLYGFPLDRLNWPLRNGHRLDVVFLPPVRSSDLESPDAPRRRGNRVNGKVLPVENRQFNHWNTDPWPIFYSVCWFLTNFPHGCDLRLNLVVPTRACFFLDSAG